MNSATNSPALPQTHAVGAIIEGQLFIVEEWTDLKTAKRLRDARQADQPGVLFETVNEDFQVVC